MSLRGFLTRQFIDVLQWNEDGPGVLAWRYPMAEAEIQNGGVLVVRESQQAMFINEGKVADIFGPGTYELTTRTLPVLTALRNWDKLFQSPFKSDVYYFATRDQVDQRWGTPQPITVRDKEYGALRIRANGVYSYKVADAGVFWAKLSGTVPAYTVEDAAGQLRAAILTSMATAIGGSDIAFVDMAANQDALSVPAEAGHRPRLRAVRPAADQLLPAEPLPARGGAGPDGPRQFHAHPGRHEAVHPVRGRGEPAGGGGQPGRHRRRRCGLGAGLAMAQAIGGAMAPAAAPPAPRRRRRTRSPPSRGWASCSPRAC